MYTGLKTNFQLTNNENTSCWIYELNKIVFQLENVCNNVFFLINGVAAI